MAYIKQIELGGSTYDIKDSGARSSITTLSNSVDSLDGRITALENATKHLIIIGDSHSTEINVTANKAWYTLVGQKLGLTVHNFACGGAGYVREVGAQSINFSKEVDQAIADTSFSNNDVDTVIVYGGVNDMNDTYSSSLASACASLCDKINANFPNAKLYIVGINGGPTNFLLANGLNPLFYFSQMKQACYAKRAIFINSCFWIRQGTAGTNPFYNAENYHPNELGDQTVASNMLNAMFGSPAVLSSSNPNACRYTATTGTGTLDISASTDYLFITGNATLNAEGIATFTDSNYFMTNQYSPQYLTASNIALTTALITYDQSTHILTVRGSANQSYYFRTVVALNP